MKLNNKGFSLVELLAVLVILITILLIAIPSITSSVERNKRKMLEKKYDLIEAQAESYVNLYKNKFDYNSFIEGDCQIGINKIKEVGLLTDEDLLDADGKEIIGVIKYENKKYIFETAGSGDGTCLYE